MDENAARMNEIGNVEIENKIMPLEDAIRLNIKAGMAIYFEEMSPSAAICEIIRQWWRQKPEFTMIKLGLMTHALSLVHCGLIKKLIFTNASHFYPYPGPSEAIQSAFAGGEVEFECWSVYPLCERLRAGALGIGFLPIKNIIGSTMAEANKDSFKVIEDPFGSGQKMGLVRRLNPDIAILHGWASDAEGNIIMPPPYSGNLWGAKASKYGAVVTVERIVSPEFVRKYSALVKLPGYMVKSVSVTPFGAHPHAMPNACLEEFEAYGEDVNFVMEHREASREPRLLDLWLKNWVLDCKNHEDYLAKLGSEKLFLLKGLADRDAWQHQLRSFANLDKTEYNDTEMMIIAAARRIKQKVIAQGYKVIFAGVGNSNLAAWLAYYSLKEAGVAVQLAMGSGWYGYSPRPADPALTTSYNVATCKMLTDSTECFGVFVGGETASSISALSAAEIDKYGNINATLTAEGLFMGGSGGNNDGGSLANEVVVLASQSIRRLVNKVSYITTPGIKVKSLVTTKGVFERPGGDAEFVLTGFFARVGQKPAEQIEEIKQSCGWELKVATNVVEIKPPEKDELARLRLFDPKRMFLGPLVDTKRKAKSRHS